MRPLTPQDKKQSYTFLVEAYMNLLKGGKLGRFERKAISRRILDQMKTATTFNDVLGLVKGLAKNYAFFSDAAVQIEAKLTSFQEQQVMNNLKTYFTSLSPAK